jgi:hypothetical protein
VDNLRSATAAAERRALCFPSWTERTPSRSFDAPTMLASIVVGEKGKAVVVTPSAALLFVSSTDQGGGKRQRDGASVTAPILGLAQEPAIDPIPRRERQLG